MAGVWSIIRTDERESLNLRREVVRKILFPEAQASQSEGEWRAGRWGQFCRHGPPLILTLLVWGPFTLGYTNIFLSEDHSLLVAKNHSLFLLGKNPSVLVFAALTCLDLHAQLHPLPSVLFSTLSPIADWCQEGSICPLSNKTVALMEYSCPSSLEPTWNFYPYFCSQLKLMF